MRSVSSLVETSLMGPVAAGTGAVRGCSCDQARTLAHKTNPNPTKLKILMITEQRPCRQAEA